MPTRIVEVGLPPSPTGEGFFDMQKAKNSPAQGGTVGLFNKTFCELWVGLDALY